MEETERKSAWPRTKLSSIFDPTRRRGAGGSRGLEGGDRGKTLMEGKEKGKNL